MLTNILLAFAVMAILALVLGFALSKADEKLSVSKDEKLVALEKALPGANCGGCGFSGCSGYAEAVFRGEAKVGLCNPGGKDVAQAMGKIMGMDKVDSPQDLVAFVACKGSFDTIAKFAEYQGIRDCRAAAASFEGGQTCLYACLRMGTCIATCKQGAISFDGHSVRVNPAKCIGCRECVKVCPHTVIKMIPRSATAAIACNNPNQGAKVSKACSAGCIGCGICEKKFPLSGISLNGGFLATFDYNGTTKEAPLAAAACPKKVIVNPVTGLPLGQKADEAAPKTAAATTATAAPKAASATTAAAAAPKATTAPSSTTGKAGKK